MDPTLQNAMMLQAIKGGASGGAVPPMHQTAAGMGAPQMQMPPPQMPMGAVGGMPPPQMPPPVDPAAQQGSFNQQQQPMIDKMAAMQNNPVAAALMSQIPGGGQ